MKVVALSCNQCGAALEVPRKANYVTCGFCNTRLRIQHTETSAFTEVIDEMAADIKVIKRNSEVARLDQEWLVAREKFTTTAKDGSTSVPSEAGSVIGAVIAVVLGIIWVSQVSSMNAPSIFPVFGVFFIGAAVVGALVNAVKVRDYKSEHEAYRSRRRDLMSD